MKNEINHSLAAKKRTVFSHDGNRNYRIGRLQEK